MRTMYDGISPLRLPDGADLYAGYDDGRWPDADAIAARFPGKKVLRITTDPADTIGDVLDVERGDATPADIPAWLTTRREAGAWPSVYCSLDSWGTCRNAVMNHCPPYPPWWIADYNLSAGQVPDGAVALQYVGSNGYDVSSVLDYWLGVDPAPQTPTTPTQPSEEDMMQIRLLGDGRAVVPGHDANGHLLVFTTVSPFTGQPTDKWSVQDVTDAIGKDAAGREYTVTG